MVCQHKPGPELGNNRCRTLAGYSAFVGKLQKHEREKLSLEKGLQPPTTSPREPALSCGGFSRNPHANMLKIRNNANFQ